MVDDILKALAGTGDAGATVAEIIEAQGKVATTKRKEIMRDKLRPLVMAGKLIPGTAPRKTLAGHMQPVNVYRLPS